MLTYHRALATMRSNVSHSQGYTAESLYQE